jgi:hypothetical protein
MNSDEFLLSVTGANLQEGDWLFLVEEKSSRVEEEEF